MALAHLGTVETGIVVNPLTRAPLIMVDATPMPLVSPFQILGKMLLSVPVRLDTLEMDLGQRDVFTVLLVKILAIR